MYVYKHTLTYTLTYTNIVFDSHGDNKEPAPLVYWDI